MRQAFGWLSVVVFAWGCNSTSLESPTAPSVTSTNPQVRAEPPGGNWSPWFFYPWQAGIGEPLALGATASATVEAQHECVPNLYWEWGARACKRFPYQCQLTDGSTRFSSGT